MEDERVSGILLAYITPVFRLYTSYRYQLHTNDTNLICFYSKEGSTIGYRGS